MKNCRAIKEAIRCRKFRSWPDRCAYSLIIIRLLPLALLVVSFGPLKASPIVVWTQDSNSAFNVTITGTLTPNQSGASIPEAIYTSPSGLWSVDIIKATLGNGPFSFQIGPTTVDYQGVYFGNTPEEGYGYSNVLPLPFSTGNGLSYVNPVNIGWHGSSDVELVSASNTSDLSTYTYQDNVYMSGPTLPAPDAGTTVAMVGLALAAVFGLRRKFNLVTDRR